MNEAETEPGPIRKKIKSEKDSKTTPHHTSQHSNQSKKHQCSLLKINNIDKQDATITLQQTSRHSSQTTKPQRSLLKISHIDEQDDTITPLQTSCHSNQTTKPQCSLLKISNIDEQDPLATTPAPSIISTQPTTKIKRNEKVLKVLNRLDERGRISIKEVSACNVNDIVFGFDSDLDEESDNKESEESAEEEEVVDVLSKCQVLIEEHNNNPQGDLKKNNGSLSPSPASSSPRQAATPLLSNQWVPECPPSFPKIIPFTGRECLNISPNGATPLDFFRLIATDELFDLIITQTNTYSVEVLQRPEVSRPRISRWTTIERKEFEKWLGLLFHMDIFHLPKFDLYWSKSPLFNIPIFRKTMGRDRWTSIMQCLHFAPNPSENEPLPTDQLYKIRPLIDFFNQRMSEVYSPPKKLSLDEPLVLWHGRLVFRQHIPANRHKDGVKLYMLTDHGGIVLRFFAFAGKDDSLTCGDGHMAKIVNSLLSDFKNKGHSIYMENLYNSIPLAKSLLEDDIYCSGTLERRKENPKQVERAKLKKGEVLSQWTSDGEVCVFKWKDKREVLFISTEHGPQLVDATNTTQQVSSQKPECISEYNRKIGGIEHFEQMMSYYTSEHKSLKWYRKLGIHIIFMMILNSHLLYKKYSVVNRLDLMGFKLDLIHNLIGIEKYGVISDPLSGRSSLEGRKHFLKYTDETVQAGKTRKRQVRCKYCGSHGKRSSVNMVCEGCDNEPGFCLLCFKYYHVENELINFSVDL